MKTNIFAFSERGSALALRISGYYENSEIHSVEKFAAPHGFTAHKSVCADMEALFREAGLLIFIGACGIAVRDIAPHIKSKTTDPAVLVLDDAGTFVIPILSGHIGGANALAQALAAALHAAAVITTATDGHGKFSVDAWAARNDCAISDMALAKAFSAATRKDDSGCFGLFINNTLKAGFRLEGIEIHIIKHGHRMLENRWNVYGIDRLITHEELLYHRALYASRAARPYLG